MRYEGIPFRTTDPRAWSIEDGEWYNRATPEAVGAHELAPRTGEHTIGAPYWPAVYGPPIGEVLDD
jgi:hypothetical protein